MSNSEAGEPGASATGDRRSEVGGRGSEVGDRNHSLLTALFCGLVGLTALTLAAAHAPGRIRLLGLFAVAFGAVCGWGLARGAAYFGVTARPVVRLAIVGVLIAAAEAGLTLESWRLYVGELRKLYDPEASTEVVGGGQPFVPESLLKAARQERQLALVEKSRFAAYLKHRVKELGDWSAPWPAVFWAAELLLGTATGVVVFRQSLGKRP